RAAQLLPALRPGLRALALEYPPWNGTAMVARIPGFARAALAEQGVPFIDDETGVQGLLSALQSGANGPVLLATVRPVRRTAHRMQMAVARRDHPYLDDHQLAGQPVLPLASARETRDQRRRPATSGSRRWAPTSRPRSPRLRPLQRPRLRPRCPSRWTTSTRTIPSTARGCAASRASSRSRPRASWAG